MTDGLPQLNPGKLLTGANIRRARREKGWTKTQLAKACGVSERAVYNWEHGIHLPEAEALDAVLEVLDLELPPGVVGRGRILEQNVESAPTGEGVREELEMLRQQVRMMGALLDRMLDRA